ncbi:DUF3943 domain-containing protein [Photobacterium sanctipauli]|uniref:DUF3943 domain-containing protein n=1 Tax=Photobacterium sanctipauli TaxID=1342794 RepID=UPI001FE6C9D1|nr:DUF3943 domain-containing protein [Photobacterium sanctipauli]
MLGLVYAPALLGASVALAEQTTDLASSSTADQAPTTEQIDFSNQAAVSNQTVIAEQPSTFGQVTPLEQSVTADSLESTFEQRAKITNTTWENTPRPLSTYDSPYNVALFSAENGEDKDRLWSQTKSIFWYGVGVAGFIALLPEDISNWDTSDDRLIEKWWDNVRQGPVWDRDVWYINYIGHPYFGGVYYQIARKSGYRQWDAFVYSFMMSTFYWEYGVEAFAEVPAIQDLVVTPVLGWVYGEWAFNKEREIIKRGGTVWGSKGMGNTALFLLDPVDSIGRGINNMMGRDVVKAGTGYIGFQERTLPNGDVDTQVNFNLTYSIGEGDTSPAMSRRYTHTTMMTTYDPVDYSIVGISAGARYLNLDKAWGVENAWAPSMTLGLYFTPSFSARLSYARIDTDSIATGERVTYENYSVDAQYYFMSDQKLRPYVTGGIGETLLDLDRDTTTFQANAGLGLHYQFHDNWGVQLDWTHYYSGKLSSHDDLLSGRLVYRFGTGERNWR